MQDRASEIFLISIPTVTGPLTPFPEKQQSPKSRWVSSALPSILAYCSEPIRESTKITIDLRQVLVLLVPSLLVRFLPSVNDSVHSGIQKEQMKIGRWPALAIPAQMMDFFIGG